MILYSKSSSLYRNMKLSLMLKKVCEYQKEASLETIEQRFFFNGHDSNDCNRCFDAIDRQKKSNLINQNIFAPVDWVQLISMAKPSQFEVINMTVNDFFSVARLTNFLIDDKHSSTGQEIYWSNISSITYTLSEPLKLSVTYFNKESAVYLLSAQDVDEFRRTGLIYSGKNGNPLSKIKFDNLQMNLNIIPAEHHEFYKSIKFIDSPLDEDFALASYESTDDNSDGEN